MSDLSSKQIVNIYSKRMQIEQSFRDLKCDRFGCAFYYSLTRKPERIAALLLIHALATFVAWLNALSLTIAGVCWCNMAASSLDVPAITIRCYVSGGKRSGAVLSFRRGPSR